MGKSKTAHCYDYVNDKYETVRSKLIADSTNVFHNATKAAAMRARTVASELRVNIAGIDLSTDISIKVKAIEDQPKAVMMPPMTTIQLEWEAVNLPHLFPSMQAELKIYPLTATETQLDFEGNYEVPMGKIGEAMDAVIGHKIADASVHLFVNDIAAYLRNELSD